MIVVVVVIMVGVCLLCLLDLLCLSVRLSLLFVTMVREIFFYELAIIVCLIPCLRVLLWVLCSPGLTGDELVLQELGRQLSWVGVVLTCFSLSTLF